MKRLRLPLVLLAAVTASAASAQGPTPRPAVRVTFEVQEPSVKSNFTPAEIAEIEAAGAAMVARHLAGRARFLDFQPAVPRYQLRVALNRRDVTSSRPDDLVLHAAVLGPGVAPSRIHWKVFRRAQQVTPPIGGSPAQFLRTLELVLAGHEDMPIMPRLTRIPLTTTVALSPQPLGWVLPYRRDELCIDPASTLRVDNVIPAGPSAVRNYSYEADASGELTPASGRQWGKVITVARAAQPEYAALRQAISAGTARVTAVYLIKYGVHPTACAQLARPGGYE
jgi:hypothetical protein